MGGSYLLGGARFTDVNEGETTDVQLQMSDAGQMVSGIGRTADGTPMNRYGVMTVLFDSDGLMAGVYIGVWDVLGSDGSFFFDGVPNGDYHLAAVNEEMSFAVGTWYPEIADPSLLMNVSEAPVEAGVIEVVSEDIEGLELTLQTAENLTSVGGNLNRLIPVARRYTLHEAYPNPFNNMTHLSFTITVHSHVSLSLFDVMGRRIAEITDRNYSPGTHFVTLKSDDLAGGTYFVRMKAGDWKGTRKIVIMK